MPDEPIPYEHKLAAKRAQEIDAKDQEAKKLQPHGGDRRKLYNYKNDVQLERYPSGNSRAAALRRLRKDRPDIHSRVLAGELSPHAGMIEAGFRKRVLRGNQPRRQRIDPAALIG